MSDLIDKQALQTELLGLTICDGYEKDYIHAIYDRIQNATTINSDDLVKHGRWIEDRDTHKCSICGFGLFKDHIVYFMDGECVHKGYSPFTLNYCPYCGAKMDGKKGEKIK